jgi:photosystem II stability/assembly factor-like uncharacterized protein
MRRQSLAVLVPLILAAAAVNTPPKTPGPAPRFDTWQVIGPGGGGTMLAPTISPHDPNLVLEHCDMTGGYITRDGGQSWRMFGLRTVIETFAYDPHDARVIYAGNAALWRSDDTGRSWRMVFPNPARKTVEHQTGDHSNYSLTTEDPAYPANMRISAIDVAPADSKSISVAFSNGRGGSSGLLVSSDGGTSFRREREFPGDEILLLHHGAKSLLAIGAKAVYRQADGKWETLSGPGDAIVQVGAGEFANTTYIYATTAKGALLVSEDEGKSWQARTPALGQQAGRFEAVSASARQAKTAYVGFRGLKLGAQPTDLKDDLYNGIAKTSDAGRTWTIVFRESTTAASNLDPSYIEGRARAGNDDIWFDTPASLGVAPGNPNICYATDCFRTYRTSDGGKTWAQVNSVRVGTDRWTTRGLDVTTNYGVHFDPFDPQHVFIDYTDIGAFHSFDGGASWQTATEGVPDRWRNTTYWLELDPQVKDLVWGAFSGYHDLPRPKMWKETDPAKYVGGVGVSTDGGRHWTPSNVGMPETSVTHLLLDPASPAGQRTLYACGFGRGVYKSTDNGKTWALKNAGIKEAKPFAWRIVRASDGILYLLLARNNGGQLGEPGGGAIYKSSDGAEHWQKMTLPDGTNAPNGLALDPRDNRRMYLAAWGQGRPDTDTGGGVFLSTDGGAKWRPVLQRSQHVYDVTVDPRNPDTLYACGFDAAAYRSTDAGQHWSRIRGYNFKWGHRVILDPKDPAKIYITTYGGSVWHGPAAGDPKAIDDILDPVPVAF